MRQVKFRAWAKDVGVMHPMWNVVSDEDGRYILMQFTGLHDKNGTEIYEGDVIETVCDDGVRLSKFVVSYKSSQAQFIKTRLSGEKEELAMDTISERSKEVIGNVYEHPQLLQ